MAAAPSGTVTFLFSDIEGSTQLLRALGPDRYAELHAEHHCLLRETWERHDGYAVDSEGDAFFVAFGRASQALDAAADAQRALAAHEWPDGREVRIRIGIHSGEAIATGGKYVGVAVHRGARICSAASGGQVLVSQATRALVDDEEKAGGEPVTAARLLGAAASIRDELETTPEPFEQRMHERTEALVRSQLGDDAFERESSVGAMMSASEAATYALGVAASHS